MCPRLVSILGHPTPIGLSMPPWNPQLFFSLGSGHTSLIHNTLSCVASFEKLRRIMYDGKVAPICSSLFLMILCKNVTPLVPGGLLPRFLGREWGKSPYSIPTGFPSVDSDLRSAVRHSSIHSFAKTKRNKKTLQLFVHAVSVKEFY